MPDDFSAQKETQQQLGDSVKDIFSNLSSFAGGGGEQDKGLFYNLFVRKYSWDEMKELGRRVKDKFKDTFDKAKKAFSPSKKPTVVEKATPKFTRARDLNMAKSKSRTSLSAHTKSAANSRVTRARARAFNSRQPKTAINLRGTNPLVK